MRTTAVWLAVDELAGTARHGTWHRQYPRAAPHQPPDKRGPHRLWPAAPQRQTTHLQAVGDDLCLEAAAHEAKNPVLLNDHLQADRKRACMQLVVSSVLTACGYGDHGPGHSMPPALAASRDHNGMARARVLTAVRRVPSTLPSLLFAPGPNSTSIPLRLQPIAAARVAGGSWDRSPTLATCG